MLSRFGLRSRMAVSYVLVSAAAVLVVEVVALAMMVPRMLAARESVEQAQRRVVEAEAEALRFKAERQAVETAVGIGTEANRVASSTPGRSDAGQHRRERAPAGRRRDRDGGKPPDPQRSGGRRRTGQRLGHESRAAHRRGGYRAGRRCGLRTDPHPESPGRLDRRQTGGRRKGR
jgi:hypothetical protein